MRTRELMDHLIKFFDLPRGKFKISHTCGLVDKDHRDDARVFCHVFHKDHGIICFSKAYKRLPIAHQIGIMLHEIGHVMAQEEHGHGGEAEADLWVQEHCDIDLAFKDTIQWVHPTEVGL